MEMMSDSLADILKEKDFDEPPEMAAIKSYIKKTFSAEVEVQVRERDIVITASSASLANNLRLQQTELKRAASTAKKLVFRIR